MFRINFLKLIRKRRKTSKISYKRRLWRCTAKATSSHRFTMLRCRFFVRLKYARFYAFFTFIITTIIEVPLRHLFAPKFRERSSSFASSKLRTPLSRMPCIHRVLCVFWSTDDRLPSTDCGRGAPEKKTRKDRILVSPVFPVFPVTPVTLVTLAPPCSRVSFLIPVSLIGLLLCYI